MNDGRAARPLGREWQIVLQEKEKKRHEKE
jgi:hypothetical protein